MAIRNGIPIAGIDLWMFGGVAKLEQGHGLAGRGVPDRGRRAARHARDRGRLLRARHGDVERVRRAEQRRSSTRNVTGATTAVLGYLASINILLLAFNLIPAFPLDGGRIARAIAWKLTGDRNRATRFAARLGRGGGYLMIGRAVCLFAVTATPSAASGSPSSAVPRQAARSAEAQADFAGRIEGHPRGRRDGRGAGGDPRGRCRSTDAEHEFFLRYGWPWFPVVDATGQARGRGVAGGGGERAEQVRADAAGGLGDGPRRRRRAACACGSTSRSRRCSARRAWPAWARSWPWTARACCAAS